MRRSLFALPVLVSFVGLVGFVACGGEAPAPSPPPPPPSPSPHPVPVATASSAAVVATKREPVVVAIVVDQLAAWIADSRLPLLPPNEKGGLTRLVREGTWAKQLTYPFAVTDTAPGHAALHTGKLPSESGLFVNELPDPKGPHRFSIMLDPSTKLVTAGGVKDVQGASAARLRVATVADRLRQARPDALIVTVSLKDRGAIVPGGKKPSHALWFDQGEGAFVTSTAFAKTFPAWAVGVGDAAAIEALRADPWEPLDREWLAKSSGMKDDEPGEGNLDGLGTTFPHVAKTSRAFRVTPAADRAIANLALAAVRAEWDPSKPTLILLSFSTNDVIGHVFGPDSWEAWDELRRLDITLGEFLAELEKQVGPVGVVLSGDHGVVPMPESTKSRAAVCKCGGGERVSPVALRGELRAAVAKAFPGTDPATVVEGVVDPYLFLSREARAFDAAKRATLDKVLREVIAKHKGIAKVFDTKTLAEKCLSPDDELALVCRSWPPGAPNDTGAGDYYLIVARGSFFDADYTVGKGTNHGSLYDYDRTVPLLVRTKDRSSAGTVIEGSVDFTAYSEIEASMLGLDPRSPKDILAGKRR